MWAADVMTRDVVTLSPDMTVEVAAERLVQRGISGAPVVDARGRLVGILSESDILRRLQGIAEENLGKPLELPEDVGFAQDADEAPALIDHGRAAHAALDEALRRLLEAHPWG